MFGKINPIRYFVFLACIFGLLFALMDYRYTEHSLAFSLIFWQIQTLLTVSFFVVSHHLLVGKLGQLTSWKKLVVSAFITSCLFTPLSLLIDVYILKEESFTLAALIEEWLNMAPMAILCWVLINLPWTLGVFERSKITSSDVPNQESVKTSNVKSEQQVNVEAIMDNPHFFSLCELQNVDDLLYLKAELHYLNVVTKHKETLILYNLKDAISELVEIEPEYGQWQTHRSFWVNKNAVASFIKIGREGELHFDEPVSSCALVSRQHIPKVKSWHLSHT